MFNKKDQLKFEVISKLVAGVITSKLAREILNVSDKTILRYKKAFKTKGSGFLIHGNKGRKSANATPPHVKEEIMNLIVEKYYDFSIRHAWEKLKECESVQLVSYKTLLRWCHEKKYIKKFKRRKSKVKRARQRMSKRGMMLQMDGSYHKWFNNTDTCLIGAIDDANNEIPYAEFFKAETTLDCMKVIQKIIENYGVFDILYVDKAGVFGGNKRTDFCQLEESCKAIGIQLIYAHTPEAKGRIERLWKTLQARLIPEMRLANIKTKKQANRYLQEEFIPKQYDKKFKLEIEGIESSYRPYIGKDLDEIFSKKEYRVIGSDQTFNYSRNKILIEGYPGNLKNKQVEIRTYQNGSIKYYWANKELTVSTITNSKKAG